MTRANGIAATPRQVAWMCQVTQVCTVSTTFTSIVSSWLKPQGTGKCLMLWLLRPGKETQCDIRENVILQSSHKHAAWHNNGQKRCALRNGSDVSDTKGDGDCEGGDSEEVCISARHPLYFSDPSPLSSSSPSGPWPYSPNNVRLWCLAS